MDAFNDSIFEERYKNFLKVRNSWMKIIFKHAVYTDINAQGEARRPVAIMTDKKTLNKVEDLLLAWQQFADFAEQRRALGLSPISSLIYSPVPEILRDGDHFSIGEFEATSTQNITREDILRKIDKKLNQLYRATIKHKLSIIDLELDKELIESYPAGTKFRRRLSGYRDIIIDLRKKTEDDNHTPLHRVGTYGTVIDGNSLHSPDAYDINRGEKLVQKSYYDKVSPIRCSLFAGGNLYLTTDIEKAKTAHKNAHQKAKKNSKLKALTRKDDGGSLAEKESQRLDRITKEKQKAQQYVQENTHD
ncbi:hypothetical protein [Xenorhabdus sp. PB30.3]|uniref:hypothetical protein n=1 Tax=Xenorhabdus sp. PB30.3 TaxID=2788941 RepID=UPI001E52C544|nr:hypothetical protein [Xenorhabdus sp. PB30.3]MCC8379108.1 hypothetical protein [Xenorhabdus sp. PB30.3]